MIKNRVGEIGFNKNGSKMTIVHYNGSKDVVVEFERGNRVHTSYERFKDGSVKNVYDRTVLGVGYIGEGDYKVSINGVHTPHYSYWKGMLYRCYSEKWKDKNRTYEDCLVSDEWHNFQTFAKWFDENYYEVDNQKMSLDKDILIKGNKLYSSTTCVFVPQDINMLFVKRDSKRGELPIGVGLNKPDGKYIARCRGLEGKLVHIGIFTTIDGAFYAYKEYKENLIKEVAEKYRNIIPIHLYYAMMDYKVEKND